MEENNAKSEEKSEKSLFGFQVISDIHIEFRMNKFDAQEIASNIVTPSAPYLCIAGDFGTLRDELHRKYYAEVLEELAYKFRHTFLVAGNHEYYDNDIETGDQLLSEMCAQINSNLRKKCEIDGMLLGSHHSNKYFVPQIHFLQRQSYDIDWPEEVANQNKTDSNNDTSNSIHSVSSPYRLCGATLWTSIQPNQMEQAKSMVNDYTQIYEFKPKDSNAIHVLDLQFIEQEIKKAEKDSKKLIVMTHHMPSFQLIAPKFQDWPGNYLFASNLDDLIRDNNHTLSAWICGHSHSASHIALNGVSLILNPLGYPREITGFSKEKVFLPSNKKQ